MIVMLVVAVIAGITLGSYLHLVSNQNISVMRSIAWNSAIGVAEAGLEEAMAHLNLNLSNRLRDGWTLDGTNVVKERWMGEDRYKVYLTASGDPPVLVSEGYVVNPNNRSMLPRPRKVRVTTAGNAVFPKGLIVRHDIDLRGNYVRTDSFDSTETGGPYDPAKARDGGDIATNSSVLDSLNAWNAKIYGKASTGPGGNVKLGANGVVGSLAWHAAGNKGAQPGWTKDDMNVQFPEVKDPFASTGILPWNLSPNPSVVGGVAYEYIVSEGNYVLTSGLTLHNKKMLITGRAKILVRGGNVVLSGNAEITIAPGAGLDLFMAGAASDISGNGIVNKTGRVDAFGYWGMKSNTQVKLAGNGEFTGTVYAPEADITLGGGGNVILDFTGASVSKSLKMNGSYSFHYDENLKKNGPKSSYSVVSWNEL